MGDGPRRDSGGRVVTYFQHGRRHRKRGTDPVGDQLEWATAWSDITTIASGAAIQTAFNFPTGNFLTNAKGIFERGPDTFGRSVDTIRIKIPGSYKVYVSAQFPAITAGRKPRVYYDPPLPQSSLQFGSPQILVVAAVQANAFFWEINSGDVVNDAITFPSGGAVWVENDAAGTFDAFAQMHIEVLDPDRFVFA